MLLLECLFQRLVTCKGLHRVLLSLLLAVVTVVVVVVVLFMTFTFQLSS